MGLCCASNLQFPAGLHGKRIVRENSFKSDKINSVILCVRLRTKVWEVKRHRLVLTADSPEKGANWVAQASTLRSSNTRGYTRRY